MVVVSGEVTVSTTCVTGSAIALICVQGLLRTMGTCGPIFAGCDRAIPNPNRPMKGFACKIIYLLKISCKYSITPSQEVGRIPPRQQRVGSDEAICSCNAGGGFCAVRHAQLSAHPFGCSRGKRHAGSGLRRCWSLPVLPSLGRSWRRMAMSPGQAEPTRLCALASSSRAGTH